MLYRVSKHIFVKPSLDEYGQHVDQVVLAGKQFTLPREISDSTSWRLRSQPRGIGIIVIDGKRAVRATEVSQVDEGPNPVSSTGQAVL
jgi:hypothetical protein